MSKMANLKRSKIGIYFLGVVLLVLVGLVLYAFIANKPSDNKASQVSGQKTQANEKSNNAYASIADKDITVFGSESDVLWDLKNPYYFYNELPIAALVHIDSIDGGRNLSPITDQYVYPQTIGKMTVTEVYKGDIKAGETLTYSRLGGILTAEEYLKGVSKAERDKINRANKGEVSLKEYVKTKFIDDIDIEVDKNYVVFLVPQTSKDGKTHEYFIDGLQYGLREAKGSGAEITVLNNETKEWESLDKLVKRN